MKIKAKNNNVKAMKLYVPVDGLIEINADGIANVSERCGIMLITGTNDWEEFKEDKNPAEDKKPAEKAEKNDSESEKNDSESEKPTDEEIISGLKKLSLEECIDTAKAAGYAEKEWEKFAKNEKAAEKLMRQYLVKKYKEGIKA